MFTLADNEKIGQYLKRRIEERFGTQGQFCREYIKIDTGKIAERDEMRKMRNRLSPILQGKKGIQLRDLPLFCRLLEVSCEDILSAGECHVPTSAHMTHYSIAFSQDKREWDEYVSREDSPILNADEYGKTVIDYALEAGNFNFLKYLMDEKYIWFVGADKENYFVGFGAGTSIEKATFPYPMNWNVLNSQLKGRDELRTQMIALAIQHKDLEMLEQLHAREIPCLYQVSCFLAISYNYEHYYNAKLMDALILADNDILKYFSKEFEITDRYGNTKRFLFPFIGELIERLLQNKKGYAEYMLKEAIRHNQYVYDQLTSLMTDEILFYKEMKYDMANETEKNRLTKWILDDLGIYDNRNLISYFVRSSKPMKGLASNIIRVNADSENDSIHQLILELNNLHDAICNITPKF